MVQTVNGTTISGTYNVNGLYIFNASTQIANATIDAGTTPPGGITPGSNMPFAAVAINGPIGVNDTFNVGDASPFARKWSSAIELTSNPTSPTDVVNLNYGMLKLDAPISFMNPPPEKINVNWSSEEGSPAAPSVGTVLEFLMPFLPTTPTWTANSLNFNSYHHNWSIKINEPTTAIKPDLLIAPAAGGMYSVSIDLPGAVHPAGSTVIHPIFM